MLTPEALFSKLSSLSQKTTTLSSIQGLLEWDQETYMPQEAIEHRASQLELMASLVHQSKTSASFKKTLEKLIDLSSGEVKDPSTPDFISKAAKLWRREYLHASKLPSSFVKQLAKTTSSALSAWSFAKKTNNFSTFAPFLTKIVHLNQKKAEYLGYQQHPYDALLDLYEPGLTISSLDPLFSKLKAFLVDLCKQVQTRPSLTLPKVSKEVQMDLGRNILSLMGFSDKTSRLDLSSHPFCLGIHPQDTRMTSRVFEKNIFSHVASVLHEGGHGLYNMNLPISYYGTPLCQPISFAMDESQSRFWETFIGKSRPFCHLLLPMLSSLTNKAFDSLSPQALYAHLNSVIPSFIRVEADEVTYCLHIILRFEMEKGLLEGSIQVKDVPSIWNQKMQELLGITPPSDAQGCLQDIHWSMGELGYFPSYALGNIIAAQLFQAFQASHPTWASRIEQGDLFFIKEWLQKQIHVKGRLYDTREVLLQVTSSPLDVTPYITYLHHKYAKTGL